ncbi:MAG: hypothetical protein K2N47_00940 [Clostridia bacterium]|nr:hypothetical protein [Clostridia bacterium]
MLDLVLKKRSFAFRMSVKSGVSVLLVVLAVALPQIVHAAGGTAAASVWMPMYAPALLAGCLLGWQWGLGVGIMSPLVSFGFTTLALGTGMPRAESLPYYVLELAAYGLISGLFAKKIQKNALVAFPAVIAAQVSGRVIYLVYNLIAGRDFISLWSNIQTGLTGLYLQAIVVPLIVIALAYLIKRDRNEKEM